jgi:hypothetical protein
MKVKKKSLLFGRRFSTSETVIPTARFFSLDARGAPYSTMRASTCVLPAPHRTSPHRRPTVGRARRARGARRVVVAASASSIENDGEKRKARLHVHVGAGKLAMGLVIPSLLESDVPTVVLQTTRAPWNGVRASAARQTRSFDESRLHMSVRHRNRPIPSARLIFDDESAVAFARVCALDHPESDDHGSETHTKSSHTNPVPVSNTFIISDDVENVWAPLLSAATSVSTAVGPALVDWLGKEVLLNALPDLRNVTNVTNTTNDHETFLPKVYCCENDHVTVRALAELLRGRAETVPVVVDKVCSALRVEGPEDEDPEEGASVRRSARRRWTAFVQTEPFPGMILPLTRSDARDPLLPFDAATNHGGVFKVARDAETAAFLHAKKLAQVNGVHTCLAFCALLASPIRDFDGAYAVRSLDDVRLRSLETTTQRLADGVWAWAVAESLAVVAAHDAAVVADAVAGVDETLGSLVDTSALSPEEARRFEDARCAYAARRVLADARESLARLSESAPDDTVGRVLNAGVMFRLEGRMRTTRDTVRRLRAKLETDVAMHGTRNGDAARRALGPVAASLVRASGFESVEALSNATDATYDAAAAVAAFVTVGAEANEAARNNAVTRPAWAAAEEARAENAETKNQTSP